MEANKREMLHKLLDLMIEQSGWNPIDDCEPFILSLLYYEHPNTQCRVCASADFLHDGTLWDGELVVYKGACIRDAKDLNANGEIDE